jgi:tRNA A-37 threonylcarbamoyl transferase component Bud32/membrane-associated phospholipid phosphatase
VTIDERGTSMADASARTSPDVATIHRRGRRRRPTGAAPPLPRKLGRSGKVWIALTLWVMAVSALALKWEPLFRLVDRIDFWWFREVVSPLRVGWLTNVMDVIKVVGSGWGLTMLGLGTSAALIVFRRWRHLLVLLGTFFVLGNVVGGPLYDLLHRPRPYGITILSGWGGFSMPSPPVGTFTMLLVGMVYALVVPGRPRFQAKVAATVFIAIFAISRVYLAVDHPSDVVLAMIIGVAIPVTMFRLITPNEVFPVTYRKGKAAHLDVSGARGDAIRSAVRDQLGLTVLDVEPVGLAASGGSTPLRVRIEGDPDVNLFAKLYAKTHVRADRWYKLGRTMMYGRLEDETAFQNVRRFVEYEDYTLRLMRDSGLPVPAPYGIVEITPEREYMDLMEFFQGAVELGDAEVDDGVIDQGLELVRKLWDAGLAHRDIKPANLMVRDGHLLLIDVSFAQVRPSPWRQAVDLGNMMLVLALRSDAERVYQRALAYFTPDEIAEAFAAARGIASPTQLRNAMKEDGRKLVQQFRAMAPKRRPISLQRVSLRRVALIIAAAIVAVLAVTSSVQAFFPLQNLPVSVPPTCHPNTEPNDAMILMAQSVPSATLVPCVATLPSGWTIGLTTIQTGKARFFLASDQAGPDAVEVILSPDCSGPLGTEVPSDEPGTQRFEHLTAVPPTYKGTRTYVFDGGCVTYQFNFVPHSDVGLVFDVDQAVTFLPRERLISYVASNDGQVLCGRGTTCLP